MRIKVAVSLAVAALSATALAFAGGFANVAGAGATTGATTTRAATAPAAPAAVKPDPWKTAIQVPGLSTSQGDYVTVSGVACPSVNHCVATGTFRDAALNQQAFITVQENGTWGRAFEVPGSAALNKGSFADASEVACPATGDCTIAGVYTDSGGLLQFFVADEKSGHWGSAHPIPGAAKLNTAGLGATLGSLACGSPGDCVVAGSYTASGGASGTGTEIRSTAGMGTPTAPASTEHALVASEKHGTWDSAIQVPGLSALKATADSWANSVSCASAGDCAVTGFYTDSKRVMHAFVADMKGGRWGNARVIPGTPADARSPVVYCAAPGDCAATGDFTDSRGKTHVYVAVETGGTWHKAATIPGIVALSNGGDASAGDISCASPGNCTTVGTVTHVASGKTVTAAYAADERGGTWHAVRLIPGTTAKPGRQSSFWFISCPSKGACAVGGDFTDSLGEHSQPFTVSEAGGTWGSAAPVPGLAALNKGADAEITALSCAAPGKCAAGGFYTDVHGLEHTFITTEE